MRDYRDAKAMAHTLRDSFGSKAVNVTHSECLEVVAKLFGLESWNVLAAKIAASQPTISQGATSAAEPTLKCTFCGKNSLEVKRLIAGPTSFICDECVHLCDVILDDEDILTGIRTDEANGDLGNTSTLAILSQQSSAELAERIESASAGIARHEKLLGQIARKLAVRPEERQTIGDELLDPGSVFLRGKTADELTALQEAQRRALADYATLRRLAQTVLDGRGT